MTGGFELEIDADLFAAFRDVLGEVPATPEPVLGLSVYIHSLAKGYGLSDSQLLPAGQLGRVNVPVPARALVAHFLPDGGDALRDRLYDVFVELSENRGALDSLNRNSPLTEVGARMVAQVFWNLEATRRRRLLPIPAGQTVTSAGREVPADIKVPGQNKDYGTMIWSERMKTGVRGLGAGQAYQSSGQGLRTKGARLAVLAARHLLATNPQPAPSLEGAVLASPNQQKRRASIVWPHEERYAAAPQPVVTEPALEEDLAEDGSPVADNPGVRSQRVLVGMPASVGPAYQRRGHDGEIDRVWSEEGERRVWLRGGPGLGKSYTARRVMHDAIAHQDDAGEELLIWVDSATPQAVREAYSAAVDSMPQLGVSVGAEAQHRVELQSRALLTVLARSTWRWLIVLDNADAGSLIDAGLIPPGGNPNGRVLITTLSRDHRLAANGRVIAVDLFTLDEAEAYLRAQCDPASGQPASLTRASETDTTALAAAVGRHPLALSIAAATIVTNAMDVSDWITEFQAAEKIDAAADARDGGGYPHLVGATWELALATASQGMPDGLVERAAMVAALQDPDGHPTWLWDRDTVTTWVTGGHTIPRHHGVPVVVQRLIDHGILQLRGDTWRQAKLAIHQLAARAVRELAHTKNLADLAAILTNEWLLQLTDRDRPAMPGTLHANIRPIAALPTLPDATADAASALLSFHSPPHKRVHEVFASNLDELAPHLEAGGAVGLAELADSLQELAMDERTLGRLSEADARFERAEQIYQQLIDDRSVSDELRARYLTGLGRLQETLGRPHDAHKSRTRAVRLYERLTERDLDNHDLSSLVSLVKLYDQLGHAEQKNRLLAQVDGYLKHAGSAVPAGTDLAIAVQSANSLRSLASQFRALGRNDEAADLLVQAIELYAATDPPAKLFARMAWEELAQIRIETGKWHAAAQCLTEVVATFSDADSRVLLASVQLRLGHPDEVTANLSAVARPSTDGEDEPAPHIEPSEDRDEWETDKHRLLRQINVMRLRQLWVEATKLQRWHDAAGLSTSLLDVTQQHPDAALGDHEKDLADAHQMLGLVLVRLGQWDESTDHLTRSAVIFEMLAEVEPDNEQLRLELARSLFWLGIVSSLLGRSDDATAHLGRSVLLWQELLTNSPADGAAVEGLTNALSELAAVHLGADHPDEAIDCYRRCADHWQALADRNVDALGPRRELASAVWDLGATYVKLDRPSDAISPLTRSVDAWQAVIQLAPDDHLTRVKLGRARTVLGWIHHMLDDTETVLSLASLAVADLQLATQEGPDNYEAQGLLADALVLLSVSCHDRGHLADAADSIARAVNITQLLTDLDPGKHEPKLVQVLRLLADLQRELGRDHDATASAARIEDLVRRFPELNE